MRLLGELRNFKQLKNLFFGLVARKMPKNVIKVRGHYVKFNIVYIFKVYSPLKFP